jgi:hypothetical protein
MKTKKKPPESFKIAGKLTVLFLVILGNATISFAQKNYKEVKINSSSVKNLIAALNSENIGLRKSAVYFAGYYKIDEVVEPLSNILNSSSADFSTRSLAAYSLFEIGNGECLNILEESGKKCKDKRLWLKCKMLTENLAEANSGVVYK